MPCYVAKISKRMKKKTFRFHKYLIHRSFFRNLPHSGQFDENLDQVEGREDQTLLHRKDYLECPILYSMVLEPKYIFFLR